LKSKEDEKLDENNLRLNIGRSYKIEMSK